MNKRLVSRVKQEYRGCTITVRTFRPLSDFGTQDTFRSFEAQDENGQTLWISDIMFEGDYLDSCKKTIDKHLEE